MSTSADKLPPSLASELARQYDIMRLLGRGGMGSVWLARERSLDRLVAIKVLSGEAIESASLRERFRREARVAAHLVHPNIVPLHAFGETPDALYFVMGYVDGETLATRLDRERRLDRTLALRILGEISDALAFAHREGVVHRDVKPENILLDAKSGRAMLADFGVARVAGAGTSVTMTGMAVGTPSYMSPEQAAGGAHVDGRSDIYSLSVVGYRMMAGRLPFNATSLQSLLAQHAVEKPDDLALIVNPADRAIGRALMRGLEKDPGARWLRADDLRDALRSDLAESTALPEELESIEGMGTTFLAPLTLYTSIMYYLSLATRAPALGVTWEAIGIGIIGGFAALRVLPAAKLFGWRDTIRTMFRPPSWWSSWWPKAFRRPDDQWDRLPPSVRRFRGWRDAVFAWLGVMVVFNPIPLFEIFRLPDVAAPIFLNIPFLTGLVGLRVSMVRARRDLMERGLSRQEATRFLALPNSAANPRWKNAQFARLLEAEPAVGAGQTPRSPAELAREIGQLNARLRAGGLLPDDESAEAARGVEQAVAALETEIQQLHQELDPTELERLEKRLATFGHVDPSLRQLLEGQRDLWQRLEQTRRDKEAKRDRLLDQLRALWMQLLELDARVARGAVVDPELTSEVRALSRDLSHAGHALTEVDRLLAPGQREVVTSQG